MEEDGDRVDEEETWKGNTLEEEEPSGDGGERERERLRIQTWCPSTY